MYTYIFPQKVLHYSKKGYILLQQSSHRGLMRRMLQHQFHDTRGSLQINVEVLSTCLINYAPCHVAVWGSTFYMQTQPFLYSCKLMFPKYKKPPITVAVRSKAGTVFACSNTGVVGSNPTRGTDVYVVLCVGSGLAKG
jgi:hypothetical protein